MSLDLPLLKDAKFLKIIQESAFVVTLGTTSKYTFTCGRNSICYLAVLSFIHSQLLQTVAVNDFKLDDVPMNVVSQSSSTSRFYYVPTYAQFATSATDLSPRFIVPMRRGLEITFTSTAAGSGTVQIDGYAYVHTLDEFEEFKQEATMT